MRNFIEPFNDFLGVLKNNLLQELYDNTPTYVEMKEEREKYYDQLITIVSPDSVDAYVDAQDSMDSFAQNYIYLRGWRNSKKTRHVNPEDKKIAKELSNFEEYKQLQTQTSERLSALQANLSPEHGLLLNKYINLSKMISGLESQYCYNGGVFDRKKLDNCFNPNDKDSWEELIKAYL